MASGRQCSSEVRETFVHPYLIANSLTINMSDQEGLDCAVSPPPPGPPYGCSGGWHDAVFSYIQNYGETQYADDVLLRSIKWLSVKETAPCTKDQLNYYLEKYCHKINKPKTKITFHELLKNAVDSPPIPLKELKKPQ